MGCGIHTQDNLLRAPLLHLQSASFAYNTFIILLGNANYRNMIFIAQPI